MTPKDMTLKVELRLQLANFKMNKNDDPTTLGDKLSVIQACFTAAGLSVDEDDLVAAGINGAPEKYSGTIVQAQQLKREFGKSFTVADLIKCMMD